MEKLKTQGKNSRSGRIFPRLASQVVLKKPGLKSASLYCVPGRSLIHRKREVVGYHLNCLDESVFMAGPKPMQTEVGIRHRLEICAVLQKAWYLYF